MRCCSAPRAPPRPRPTSRRWTCRRRSRRETRLEAIAAARHRLGWIRNVLGFRQFSARGLKQVRRHSVTPSAGQISKLLLLQGVLNPRCGFSGWPRPGRLQTMKQSNRQRGNAPARIGHALNHGSSPSAA